MEKDSEKLKIDALKDEDARRERQEQAQLKITALNFASNPNLSSNIESLITNAEIIYNFIKE